MRAEQVQVAWPQIERQLETNGHDHVHLVFAADEHDGRPPEDALAAARAAVDFANSRAPVGQVAAQPDADPGPYGPVVELDWIGTQEQTRAWLTDFAGHLAAGAWSGVVGPMPYAAVPARGLLLRPKVALFAAYPAVVDRVAGPAGMPETSGWGVDAGLTLELCRELLTWIGRDHGELYLQQGRSQVEYRAEQARVHRGDLPGYLAWSLTHSQAVSVYQVRRDPVSIRHGHLGTWGEAVYELDAETRMDPLDQVRELRPLLVGHARDLEVAFLRSVHSRASSWMDVAPGSIGPYGITEMELRDNRHLWAKYVPDAHGLQVLTAEHLRRATNLGTWTVTEIAPDRFLVEARDLERWFAADEPDPGVLATAREDFGHMLLTPDVVATNPA
jgi:hypothetical protein